MDRVIEYHQEETFNLKKILEQKLQENRNLKAVGYLLILLLRKTRLLQS